MQTVQQEQTGKHPNPMKRLPLGKKSNTTDQTDSEQTAFKPL